MYSRLCIAAGAGRVRRRRGCPGGRRSGAVPEAAGGRDRMGIPGKWGRRVNRMSTSAVALALCACLLLACWAAAADEAGARAGRMAARSSGQLRSPLRGGGDACRSSYGQGRGPTKAAVVWQAVSGDGRGGRAGGVSFPGPAWGNLAWGNHALDLAPNSGYHNGLTSSLTGRGAARLARLLWEQEVGGSNPLAPTRARL